MTRPAALTIDLDYWGPDPFLKLNPEAKSRCETFLRSICNKYNGEISIYREHDDMLEDLNKIKFSTLINIDQHDDLADDVLDIPPEFSLERFHDGLFGINYSHCGNWPYFLKDRKEIDYIWCSDPRNSTRVAGYDTHHYYGFRGYKEIDNIDLELLNKVNLKYVGVCYSQDWVNPLSVADGLCFLLRDKKCRIDKDVQEVILWDLLSRATQGEGFSCSMSENERIAKGA
jgi:hypothetical protein